MKKYAIPFAILGLMVGVATLVHSHDVYTWTVCVDVNPTCMNNNLPGWTIHYESMTPTTNCGGSSGVTDDTGCLDIYTPWHEGPCADHWFNIWGTKGEDFTDTAYVYWGVGTVHLCSY